MSLNDFSIPAVGLASRSGQLPTYPGADPGVMMTSSLTPPSISSRRGRKAELKVQDRRGLEVDGGRSRREESEPPPHAAAEAWQPIGRQDAHAGDE
ncbi:hypothetical protein EYF80_067681 [Liparis tanakae]|uniref:Uncharacterized protein n=1 Tax=Liparis tanakae TaxID=230148 RepID=A0A4Z2E0B2_9TELE|nr:hypothetical protein EYF80_067681 [Liparis tanakae]